METLSRLMALGRKRQRSRWDGYGCIGDYHNGIYECEFVSPYSKSAHNVDASLMVLLQDWASHDYLSGPLDRDAATIGYTPWRSTNKNLIELLQKHFAYELRDTFATNVFPFVKMGDMSDPIPQSDFVQAAKEFALPQIEIVSPIVAVCLGVPAFNALRTAAGIVRVANLEQGIASPFPI